MQYFKETLSVLMLCAPVFYTVPLKKFATTAKHQTPSTALGGVGAVSVLFERDCIYIQQHSSFRVPTLWFINPTVTTCHIQYTFLSLCHFFFQEKTDNMKILEVCHFRVL